MRWFVRDGLAVDDLVGAFSDLAGAPDADAVLNAIWQALQAIGAPRRPSWTRPRGRRSR